ncbi:MAG: TlpA family protein disulfide reductase [Bacteroidetes bacterium]|nr:TlpA family protein disulfide reductase [Bacteroidota bacterium]MBS1975435.1 TlpA family protein disulfide reductase [Bacteroidota bacterium]
MRLKFQILLFLLVIAHNATYGQDDQPPSLRLGDAAPPLRVREWLKGKPIEKFEKGKVYVIEFWATWCNPCKAAVPRLSKLARKYKNKAVFIGMDVYEQQVPLAYRKNINQIKAFVDSMGRRMKYNVAIGDSSFMETAWLKASGEQGIPKTFIINAEGIVAWIGHPMHLQEVLPKIVNNEWDTNEAIAKHNSDKHLEELDDSLSYKLIPYNGDPKISGDFGKPDSALLVIEELVRREPKLKYAPNMAHNTFSALLKTNQRKAYEYGKQALINPAYDEPAYSQIIYLIEWWSDKITLRSEIYELGAEAYQVEIDHIPYPEIANLPKLYNKMAAWYWRANNKSKAIDAEKQAIKAMKKRRG